MFKMLVFNRLCVVLAKHFFLPYVTYKRMDEILKLGIEVDHVMRFTLLEWQHEP